MKINLNKSTKRALSLALALAVAIGSLFTANIGINITVDAATLNIKYWDSNSTVSTSLSGGGTQDNPYLIKSVADFAYVATGADGSTAGEYYKIDNDIDALVLQPDTYGAAIMALDSADAVKTYFETNKSNLKKWKSESATAGAGFNGHFDGNGAIICGMYTNTSGSIGLFTNLNSSTIENVIIKNNYSSGDSAAIICSQSKDSGAVFNFNKCELFNNVVISTRLNDNSVNYGGLLLAQTTKAFINIDNCIIYGNIATHSESVTYWYYETAESASKTSTVVSGYDVTYGLWGTVAGNSDNGVSGYNTVSNSIILDTFPHAVAWDYNGTYYTTYDNVYTNMTGKEVVNTIKGASGANATGADWTELTISETVYTITTPINASGLYDLAVKKDTNNCVQLDYTIASIDSEGAKGSLGKLAMDLDWATDEQDATWYAIDGEYPTLFKPEGWKDCETITPWDGTAAESFAADAEGNYGDGSAEKPYLIETPEQLFAMVKAGGKVDGTPAYYKVKDGVKNLYLSKTISGGYDAVKTLAGGTAGTDYYNWYTENHTAFVGNFDGNGVTIRGMISKSATDNRGVGLVQWLGTNAVVKNVNFDTCYAEGTKSGAILASKVTALANDNNDGTTTGGTKNAHVLVYNIAVRNSYSKGTYAGGVISENTNIPDMLEIVNCVYDGYSCYLDGSYKAGIFSTVTWLNNLQIVGCVSLNAAVSAQKDATGWTADQYAGWQKNSNLTDEQVGVTQQDTTMPYNDYRTGIDGARYVAHTKLSDGSYEPSRWYWNCHPVYVYNTYTDVKETYDTTAVELVDENGASTVSDLTDTQELMDAMPLLDWTNGYYVAEVEDGRVIPMPRVRTADDIAATYQTDYVVLNYGELIGVTDGGAGSSPYNGRDGHFENLVGSGTESDPYIITTAKELARVVAAGGTKLNNSLYFKLANDIDVSGMPWISTVGFVVTSGSSKVVYVPFAGKLDGDGHTITGLYAVNNDGAAGLIPELASTGVVKNLHIRNGHVGSSEEYTPYVEVTTTVTVDGETQSYGTGTALDRGNSVSNVNTAGAIAGIAADGAQIIGCSVENTIVVNTESNGLVGTNNGASIKNSYIDEAYYNADGAKVSANDFSDDDFTTGVWYKGGLEGSMPQLVNRAAAMTETDVSGLGDTDYNSADLSALRNKLLRKSAYKYIYGDVNRDGVINSTDLVILRRAMVDDYKDLQDGFWRNVEKNQTIIYYEENDTQDMARKLELYLEAEVPGVDILKYALKGGITDDSVTNTLDSRPTQNAIIVLKDTPTDDGYDDYSVTYDSANNVLTVNGGSFTAVEQAVIEFMKKADRATNNVGECTGSILDETLTDIKITNAENADELLVSTETESEAYSYKQRVKVGDTYYYYAWGDEFEGVSDTISSDTWGINKYRGEESDGSGSMYLNQENPNLDDLKTLWVCEDGRLSIWRGVNTGVESIKNSESTWSWGYKGIDLGTGTTNDFGKEIDADDVYIDPGLITTQKSMLFKQGYIEMEASLPSDGHAFPAWWFYTYNGATSNNDISKSLYGKVFELNNDNNTYKWDEVTDKINASTGLTTYKYKIPTAYLEFDIVETMQTLYSSYDKTTGYVPSTYTGVDDLASHYNRDFNLTVHKTYKSNVVEDQFYLIDWDNYTVSSPVTWDTFNSGWDSTSADHGWTHAYNNQKDGYGSYEIKTSLFKSSEQYGAAYLGRNMTATVKYGFAWNVDVSNKTYNIDVYVSTDGAVDTESPVLHIDQDTGHLYQDTIWSNKSNKETADAELWNQYAYMLLDNGFYTANSGSYTQFTELLELNKSGGADDNKTNYYINDKTTFDINYVRVYQQDGMRDIVTRDTDDFNNGNHFGYGE